MEALIESLEKQEGRKLTPEEIAEISAFWAKLDGVMNKHTIKIV